MLKISAHPVDVSSIRNQRNRTSPVPPGVAVYVIIFKEVTHHCRYGNKINIPLEGVNLDKSSAPLTNITVDLDALTKEVDSVTVDGEETCKLMDDLDNYPTLPQYILLHFTALMLSGFFPVNFRILIFRH